MHFLDSDDNPQDATKKVDISTLLQEDDHTSKRVRTLERSVGVLNYALNTIHSDLITTESLIRINDKIDSELAFQSSSTSLLRAARVNAALESSIELAGIKILSAKSVSEENEEEMIDFDENMNEQKQKQKNMCVITTLHCRTIGDYDFNVVYKSADGKITHIDAQFSLSLQLVLPNHIIASLCNSLSLPTLFQCAQRSACVLLSRAAQWASLCVLCSQSVITIPSSLTHCEVFTLSVPRNDKVLLITRITWEIRPSDDGEVNSEVRIECRSIINSDKGNQLANAAEVYLRNKLAVGCKLEDAILSLCHQLDV